jgi:hypothetical protein
MTMWGSLMQFGNALIVGARAGYYTARRVFEDPTQTYQQTTWDDLSNVYTLLWAYYSNSMFERGAPVWQAWSTYKSTYSLYRNIRMIYNPTRRLVNFYAGQVYPGILPKDGKTVPQGTTNAFPFAADTPDELLSAIAQFWQWSGWQAKKGVLVRYGAALGSVLVEVVDDLEHGKLAADIVWPGFVHNLQLDHAGNVKSYAIQYSARELEGTTTRSFMYRKEVDGQAFRYYRNGEPYDYGEGAISSNPYGFVPAVWIKHNDSGSDLGSPAITGTLGKIDEMNNLASHIHDHIHKVIGSPVVLWSSGTLQNLFGTAKRPPTDQMPEPAADQENVLMLRGPADGHSDSLAGNLNIADAALELTRLLEEIERDHPELTVFEKLQQMSQVTGPAASRLVAPVIARLTEASANYDQQVIKLFQMALAIGGFRAQSGAWGPLTTQQQKFLPFSLDSYESGDLDVTLLPRPLILPTDLEIAQGKMSLWQGVNQAVQAGAPLPFVLRDAGMPEEQLAQLGADQVQKIQQDQLLAQQDVIPAIGQ